MAEMQDKLSSTGAGMSRENSLSSLPETECEWPHLDDALVREPAPLTHIELCDAASSWQQIPALIPPPPEHQAPTVHMPPPASLFQVAFLGGIEVRAAPDYDAPRTGLVLMQNEVFAVSHQVAGSDGRLYLGLADGQGWVFDDSNLVPHDPSVVQLPYTGAQVAPVLSTWDFLPAPGGEAVPPPPLPGLGVDSFATQAVPMLPPPVPPPPHPPPLHPAPHGEILSSAPVTAAAASNTSAVAWYRVAYLGGINLRCGPSFDAPLTGVMLHQMETFPVAEEVVGSDGRVYLRLCDGRGWAFDDSALMPLDPSVKRGNWMPAQSSGHVVGTRVLQEVQADALPVRRRMHPQPRGKRGGKRITKRSQNSSSTSGSAGGGVQGPQG